MKRFLPFTEEHHAFRDAVKRFMQTEVAPYHEEWEKQGMVTREVWKKAGENGLLCPEIGPEYGGAGADFLYNTIIIEECAKVRNTGFFISLHSDVK